MKKIGAVIGLVCLLLSGCDKNTKSNTTEEVNISQWMMDSSKTGIDIVGILGSADDEQLLNDDESYATYTWNDYELVDGYIGTLQVTNYPDLNAYIWRWSKTATEKEFNTIYATVENYLGEVSGVYEDDKENTSYSFNFIKQDGVFSGDGSQVYYPLTIFYGNDIITVQWGHNGLSFGEASELSSES